MIVPTIIVFGLLLWIARLHDPNLLFPPALFAGVWLLTLTGLLIWGGAFYPVPDKAFLVYIVGGAAFTLGGVLALRLRPSTPGGTPDDAAWTSSPWTLWALDFMLAIVVIGLPFYWRQLSGSFADLDLTTIFQNIRSEQVERGEEASSFSIILNLGTLSQFTVMAMFFESNARPGRRWRAIVAVVAGLVYESVGGAKVGAISILIMLAFIYSIQARRLKLFTIGAAFGIGLAFFSVGVMLVNFAYESFGGSLDAFQAIGRTIRLYWLGGVVAFGAIALNPNAMVTTQPINRFYVDTARALGAHINAPPKHADFTPVSADSDCNVYTIYFSYFKDHGWLGTVVIMLGLGAMITLLYKKAMRGTPIATILFADLAFHVCVMSIFAENFFYLMNSLIKLVFLLMAFYWFLPALEARRKTAYA